MCHSSSFPHREWPSSCTRPMWERPTSARKRSRNDHETLQRRLSCILGSSNESVWRRGYRLLSDPVSNDTDMASLEATSHPFLVRIWLEEGGDDAHPATWRGHITHVPSGERRYIQNLESIPAFIAPYLEEMGVELTRPWRRNRGRRRQEPLAGGEPQALAPEEDDPGKEDVPCP